MIERKVVVRVAEGLHARPATEFVKLARRFSADIEIVRGDKTGNAKSPVKLMLLGVKEADEIVLRANGSDEAQALDALCRFVSLTQSGEATSKSDTPAKAAPVAARVEATTRDGAALHGLAASEGAAIGPSFFFALEPVDALRREIGNGEIDPEIAKLRLAVEAVNAELAERGRKAAAGSDEAQIIEALREIARDVEFARRAEARIRAGQDAVSATHEAGEQLAAEFEGLPDPYQRARGDDVRAVARKVALSMLGKTDATLADAPPGSVILAREISAFDLAGASLERFGGLVCTTGGPTSHVAIIARSYGVPAVLGLDVDVERLRSAHMAALDGATGEVALDPDAATERRFREQIARNAARKADLQAYVAVEPRTRDGRRIEIAANLGSLKEIDAALAVGAMGVGLFRTELLFMERRRPPTEDEQAQVYARLAEAFAPAPVIVRTLDVGGDKPTPGLEFPHEDNPFLGWRGIRMCLDRPEVFKPQLRALLRAAVRGNLKVMLPMVADVEEILRTKRLIEECRVRARSAEDPLRRVRTRRDGGDPGRGPGRRRVRPGGGVLFHRHERPYAICDGGGPPKPESGESQSRRSSRRPEGYRFDLPSRPQGRHLGRRLRRGRRTAGAHSEIRQPRRDRTEHGRGVDSSSQEMRDRALEPAKKRPSKAIDDWTTP